MDALKERMEKALDRAMPRMDKAKLAEKLGFSRQRLSNILATGGGSEDRLIESAKILNVPAEWLIHGTGPAPEWAKDTQAEQENRAKQLENAMVSITTTMAEIAKSLQIQQQISLEILAQLQKRVPGPDKKEPEYGQDSQKSPITGRIKWKPPSDDQEKTQEKKAISEKSGA